jgi:hypothetical protein
VEGAALGQSREQMAQTVTGDSKELLVRTAVQHRLGDAERDDLLIGDRSPRVGALLWQEIVGAVNSDQQQIEVSRTSGCTRCAIARS